MSAHDASPHADASCAAEAGGDGDQPHGAAQAEEVESLLAWEIQTLAAAPGARLREVELAERFATTRAVVREALRLLSQEGLVELEPWKGARVVAFDRAQLSDLFDLQAATFGLAARLAAQRATRAQIADLRAHLALVDGEVAEGAPPGAFYCRRGGFVELVSRAAGSFDGIRRRMGVRLLMRYPFALLAIKTPAEQRRLVDNWRELVDRLDAGDAHAAELSAIEGVTIMRDVTLRKAFKP
jgi:DNA-binding GntR family transcriptional regulator